jgi:lipopolysaccharide biosynthesis protein
MATHHGNEGTVKIGSNTLAEIDSFQMTETANVADDTAMGDAWETHVGGGASAWTGQVDCHWDETDTNGQVALTIGASVTLNMYPEGASAGDKYYSGTATVTQISRQNTRTGVVSASFQFRGNGALSLSTAA